MARISQQFKDFLNLLATVVIGIASGFLVDASAKHEPYASWVALVLACLALQVALLFVKSQEMLDLEKYRNELEAYHNGVMLDLQARNAMAAQELKAVEEGRLDDALKWGKALAGRKERKP